LRSWADREFRLLQISEGSGKEGKRRLGPSSGQLFRGVSSRLEGLLCCRCQVRSPTVVVDSSSEIRVFDVVDVEEWGERCFDFFPSNSSLSTPIGRLFVAEAEHEVFLISL